MAAFDTVYLDSGTSKLSDMSLVVKDEEEDDIGADYEDVASAVSTMPSALRMEREDSHCDFSESDVDALQRHLAEWFDTVAHYLMEGGTRVLSKVSGSPAAAGRRGGRHKGGRRRRKSQLGAIARDKELTDEESSQESDSEELVEALLAERSSDDSDSKYMESSIKELEGKLLSMYSWLQPESINWSGITDYMWSYVEMRERLSAAASAAKSQMIPLSNLINFSDYVHVSVPFVAHLSLAEARGLKVGDMVDIRYPNGRYGMAEVSQLIADSSRLRLHIPGYDSRWDVVVDYCKELHRLALPKSISVRRALNALQTVSAGHYCDLHLGCVGIHQWVVAQCVRRCEFGSGQCEFVYNDPMLTAAIASLPQATEEFGAEKTADGSSKKTLWVHLDNCAEVDAYGSHTSKGRRFILTLEETERCQLPKHLFAWFLATHCGFERYLQKFVEAEVDAIDMLSYISEQFLIDEIHMTNAIHRQKLLFKIDELNRDSHQFFHFIENHSEPALDGVRSILSRYGLISWEILNVVVGRKRDIGQLTGIKNQAIVDCLFSHLEQFREHNTIPVPRISIGTATRGLPPSPPVFPSDMEAISAPTAPPMPFASDEAAEGQPATVQ